MDQICVTWTKLMRSVYKLNCRTHDYIINDISCAVEILLHRKTARCIYSLINIQYEYIVKVLSYFYCIIILHWVSINV